MKTIHVTTLSQSVGLFVPAESAQQKHMTLMKTLYNQFLKEDDSFHFFFMPKLIIRIESEDLIQQVSDFLSEKKIEFKIYDYPFPEESNAYGEARGGIVARNLKRFIRIFHENSLAALEMGDADHQQYMETVVDSMFNPHGYTPQQQSDYLAYFSYQSAPNSSQSECVLL